MNSGNKIKKARIQKNISQVQLAELIGTSQAMITAYENGKRTPKIETLERIAAALDINVFTLLPSSISKGSIMPTQEERALLAAVSDLNNAGIKKVCEFAEDISTNPKYRR